MTAAFGLIGQYREERRSRPPCFPNNGEDGERRGGERGAPGRAQDDPLHFEQLSYDEPLVGPVARI